MGEAGEQFPDDKDAILVHAIGQQFNWNFHLPGPDGQFGRRDIDLVTNSNPLGLDPNDPAAKDDMVVLGELHVPVDRPVIIEISSKDVIHNFALPTMRMAQDAIPGQIIPMWFRPIKTGTYEIVCGQLCGLGHYGMKGRLVVDNPADYQAWLKERAELAGTHERTAAGPLSPKAQLTPSRRRGRFRLPEHRRLLNRRRAFPPAEVCSRRGRQSFRLLRAGRFGMFGERCFLLRRIAG